MAEGGEGEDEIQFLRTVSTRAAAECARGSSFCMCRNRDRDLACLGDVLRPLQPVVTLPAGVSEAAAALHCFAHRFCVSRS